ncbi:hypothetical protein [Luteimonas abyssi]|uniref:hypothetical protein n=1 Tax=Luteimonas abyssi TaxID=1247514 RepID=UPI000AE5F87E|nr:hypothetical protein [Luteimonas abyssi]
MSVPALHELHAGLEALDGAIDADDLSGAGDIMSAYDRQLRQYIEQTGQDAPLAGLRQLLGMQNALLSRMRDRQEALGDELRRDRRAVRASQAYAQVGVSL